MAGVTRSRTTAASIIKSIQRGQTSIGSSNAGLATSTTVTINAVDLDKSFVSVSFRSGYGSGNGTSGTYPIGNSPSLGGYLSSTTVITLTQGQWGRYNVSYLHTGGICYWEVIEYE
tara:strand:+ start:701 stop:1048 length:348 start_codon:yes stop_codon:yes gene_type:complete